ncbi:MAG: hypothetical protein M5U34_49010 [Chloroflexi bacterium]|nr:hypothetical protein [Chloroflexota bacterium]
MTQTNAISSTTYLREYIVGLDRQVPLLDGSLAPYVNLDNAASTPFFPTGLGRHQPVYALLLQRPSGYGLQITPVHRCL